jgi:hypothetical protein
MNAPQMFEAVVKVSNQDIPQIVLSNYSQFPEDLNSHEILRDVLILVLVLLFISGCGSINACNGLADCWI